MLVGIINQKELEKKPYKEWFEENYVYTADSKTMEKLSRVFTNDFQTTIFMGTWCPDSHNQVPKILNIFEQLSYTNYVIYSLDREKKSKEGYEKDLDIGYVPTFIIYKDSNEIGRIIETPEVSLEKDLLNILEK